VIGREVRRDGVICAAEACVLAGVCAGMLLHIDTCLHGFTSGEWICTGDTTARLGTVIGVWVWGKM